MALLWFVLGHLVMKALNYQYVHINEHMNGYCKSFKKFWYRY